MTENDPEIEYLRAVEELFTTLRGVPHILSPKDVQLARQWWRDDVPLAAIGTGVGEVLDRKRAAGEHDPVVSLSYCRHAVKRSARRLAEQRVGESAATASADGGPIKASVEALATELREASRECRVEYPEAAEVIDSIADQIDSSSSLSLAEIDEHLFVLETALLEGCFKALPAEDRVRTLNLTGSEPHNVDGVVPDRISKALRDRSVRQLLSLPRLEIS